MSPYDVSRNILFLGMLPEGDIYVLFLDTYMLKGDGISQTFDIIGGPEIGMVDTPRASTSVSSITNYNLHTIKR